jgi:hypothetical protein
VGGGGQGYFGQFFNFVFPHVSVVCARIIRRCSVDLLAGFFDCFLPCFLACFACLRVAYAARLLLRFSFTPKNKTLPILFA